MTAPVVLIIFIKVLCNFTVYTGCKMPVLFLLNITRQHCIWLVLYTVHVISLLL